MTLVETARSYADLALTQGKRGLTVAQTKATEVAAGASARAAQVPGQLVDLPGRIESLARGFDLGTVRSSAQPYVERLEGLRDSAERRASAAAAELRRDPRFQRAYAGGEAVFETVNEHLVAPALSVVHGLRGSEDHDHPTAEPEPKPPADDE